MSIPFTSEQLKQNIHHDLATSETLLEVLQREQEALKTRDFDAVSDIIDKKVPMLERLEASAQLRQAWAQAANKPNDETGWAELITDLGTSEIKQEWARLKSLYSEVRTQNEVNGKLLSRHQSTVSRLLDVMRGKTANPNLYTASGYSSSQAHSNKFGEA